MLKLLEKKQHVLFACAGLFCFFSAFILLQSFKGRFGQEQAPSTLPQMEDTIEISAAMEPSEIAVRQVVQLPHTDSSDSKWVVYITGSVKKPGVYELQEGSRAYQALEAAGGFSIEADQESVNLAIKLSDGMHIRFPSKNESSELPKSGNPKSSSQLQAATLRAGTANKLVNLNTCTAAELEILPGIGSKTASLILGYREENGNFKRTEDLLQIKGIGPKKYDAIRQLVTVEF